MIPFDTDLEEHIIACMIYDPKCIADVYRIVKPRFFYHECNARLCDKIFKLWGEDETSVDITALSTTIRELGLSVSQVAERFRSIVTTANLEQHCTRLRDIAALRAAIRVSEELQEASELRDSDEIREAISKAEAKLSRITETVVPAETMKSADELAVAFHEDFDRIYNSESKTGVTGVASHFPDLDILTAGFQPSDLIILAARPSVGKTAFMNQLAMNMSVTGNEPGAIFSLEMSSKQLIQRMVANQGNLDLQRLRTGLIAPDDYVKYTTALGMISSGNFVIDDQAGMSVPEIKAKARKVQRERGLSYIMIDYLQLIRGEKGQNRYETVTAASGQLKGMAKELNVPVIALSQLSRSVEQRGDKKPMMSDLRESGAIEQDADIVAFLHREDYYDHETDQKNITQLIIAKHRNGPVGTVEFAFIKQYGKFLTLDRKYTPRRESDPQGKRKWAG